MNNIGKLPASKKDVETAVEKAVDKLADMIGVGFEHNDKRLGQIEGRLSRLENLMSAEHRREIDDLKNRMKRLEEALAV